MAGWFKKTLETAEHLDFIWTWGWRIFVALGGSALITALLGIFDVVTGYWLLAVCCLMAALFFLLLGRIRLDVKAKDASAIAPVHLDRDVELTPSRGPATELFLKVKNCGDMGQFHAKCTPVALRNSPNELVRKTFDLKWEHTSEKQITLSNGDSGNLLIATLEDDREHALGTMRIWGVADGNQKQYEWSRWNLEPRETLPEYDLEIQVFSGDEAPSTERFTLRPKAFYGPLEMVKLAKPTTTAVDLLKCRFVTETLGEPTGTHREAYNIFLHLRCVTSRVTRLSLSRATLELNIDGRNGVFEPTDRLGKFRLKEEFKREKPIFGITDDYRWVQLPDLLHVVLEPGVYSFGWLHFFMESVSPRDLEQAKGRLSIIDALGEWHSIEINGLKQDRTTVIYDEVFLRN